MTSVLKSPEKGEWRRVVWSVVREIVWVPDLIVGVRERRDCDGVKWRSRKKKLE